MNLEFTTLVKLIAPVAKTIAPILLKQIRSKLNPTVLEKALKYGIIAAQKWNKQFPTNQSLFFRSQPDAIQGFLEQFFRCEIAQEELQRPLKGEGAPRVSYLVKVFKQVAADNPKITLLEEQIEPWLREFSIAYFEQTDAYLKFQIAKENYLEQLKARFDDVKFGGIDVEGQEVERSEKLVRIFVMPDVIELIQINQALKDLQRKFSIKAQVSDRRAEGLLKRRRETLQEEQPFCQKFSAQQLLAHSQSRKLVLLGGPGSGKTTLMSYFAVVLAQNTPEQLGLSTETDWLPILIRIRDLDRYPDMNILTYLQQFTQDLYIDLPPGFFEYWLRKGKALILLDGLDEVADSSKRSRIVDHIDAFLRQYPQNRAIVTSRPAGYRPDYFRTDEFSHYQLQPFDDSKIEKFVNHWYENRFQSKDPAEGRRRRDSLMKALEGNDQIKLLARNPLLLTVIVLIHRYRAYLPRKRYALYERAIDTLLTAWDAEKELQCDWDLEMLKRLMQRVAYWVHTRGSMGDPHQSSALIERTELIQELSDYLVEERNIKPYKAKAEAKRFLDHIRNRAGLINEQGLERYAFVHKTFQEYLAAEEIRYRQVNEDFQVVLDHIQAHLHDAHWREVLLLLIAQQPPTRATQCIEAILKQPKPYEEYLHRNLLFAGSCLAEDLRVSKVSLAEDVLRQLVALETTDSSQVIDKIHAQVYQTLCNLNETTFQNCALDLLNAAVNHIDSIRLQKYRAALGDWREAVKVLLTSLNAEYSNLRSSAAQTLGNLGQTSEEIIQALLTRLNDEEPDVRYSVARALGNLGQTSGNIIQTLLPYFNDEDSHVRSSAAHVFGNLGQTSEDIVRVLLEHLNDEDSEVRSSIIQALGSLSGASEDVIVQALLAHLNDEDSDVRSSAVYALGNLAQISENIIQALLARLNDEDAYVRSSAAQALGNLRWASEAIIQALLVHLNDEDAYVRSSAAYALGNLGQISEDIVQALLAHLNDENSYVRSSAAYALGNLGWPSEDIVQALLASHNDEDSYVRSNVVQALGNLGQTSEDIVQVLLAHLNDETSHVRSSSAQALGKLGARRSDIANAVAQWIEQYQKLEHVHYGINALWDLLVE